MDLLPTPRHHSPMRTMGVLALLLVAGCIPGGKRVREEVPRPAARAEPARATQQCLADLDKEGVKYKGLPDRRFANGCSAAGAVQPAAQAWLGRSVVRIESFGTYSCRPVNSQPGAKLSEHGRANAVDIAAFVIEGGRRIDVAGGWNGGDEDVRRFLRSVHQAGCRRFAVGLGPDSDSFHRDHLHFDMGQGPYCR